MMHIIASLAFSLITVAAGGLIVFTLADARDAIIAALGMPTVSRSHVPERRTRIRAVARPVRIAATSVRRAA